MSLLLAAVILAHADPAVFTLPALESPVAVSFDDRGVPVIAASDRRDAAAALGFVHARDRMFQMDLMRRAAAGELAALVGPAVVDRDLAERPRGFRRIAGEVVAGLPEDARAVLDAYAAGANAAVATMRTPPEYAMLGWPPAPWSTEDSILVALAMHSMLLQASDRERAWGEWRACLGEPMFEFLVSETSRFDALLVEPDAPEQRPPIPGASDFSLRAAADEETSPGAAPDALLASRDLAAPPDPSPLLVPGSNAFVVSGARTADGRAILANDPHLRLSMPPIWYRVAVERPGVELVGLSLPGVPAVLIGSNGRVAWGFTNLTGDLEDWIVVEVDPRDPGRYLVEGGSEPFGELVERIEVRGAKTQELRVRTTRWGPVAAVDRAGRTLVLRTILDDPAGTNLDVIELEEARGVEEALAILARWRGAPQNALVADADGRIGWTVTGFLPDRGGADGRTPRTLAPGADAPWSGPLDESLRPRVIDPPSGFLFTANARPLPLERSRLLGSHWAPPTRASRIRALLEARLAAGPVDEESLLAVQLDAAVAALEPWREVVLAAVPEDAAGELGALRSIAASWSGTADESERGPVVLGAVRSAVSQSLLRAILRRAAESCGVEVPDEEIRGFRVGSDEPWLRLLEEQPPHLLPRGSGSWQEFVLSRLSAVAARPELRLAEGPDACPTWGDRNAASIRHPISLAMPFLAKGYDVPAHPQPGHPDAVRVAAPTFGASARLVVSPSREEDAILQTPGGQSGDPTSPRYRDLHESWRLGRVEPLLPGAVVERIELRPAG